MPHSTFLNLPEEKKARIIDASVKEFLNMQYEKASINKIIKSADIPRGSFYQYFKNKDDLYFYCLTEIYKHAFEEYCKQHFDILSKALGNIQSSDWLQKIRARKDDIVSIIGEEQYEFLDTVNSAPKHIQQNYYMNISTTLMKPFLLEILQKGNNIKNKSDIDFFAFLLSMCDFLTTEFCNIQNLDIEQRDKYSGIYLDMIFQKLTTE